MSEVRDPATDQPLPVKGQVAVHQAVIDSLPEWNLEEKGSWAIERGLRARLALGVRKYGTPLESHNGRDALQDAWEEALDTMVYVMQLKLESDPGDALALSGIESSVMDVLAGLARLKTLRGDVEVL